MHIIYKLDLVGYSPKFPVVTEGESELFSLTLGDVRPFGGSGKEPRQRETSVQEITTR